MAEGCCRAAVDSEGFTHDHAEWLRERDQLQYRLDHAQVERDQAVAERDEARVEAADLDSKLIDAGADHDRLRRDLGEAAAVRTKLTEQVEALCVEQDRLRASLAEARTWRGVQAFIDEQYPVSVFPVEPDSEQRDDGARILSLLRHLDEALRVVDMHHWPLPASLAEERKQTARLRAEVEFWQGQQKLAANVASTIADLDEQAPALRDLLRAERLRREKAETALDVAAYRAERMRAVVEAARGLVGELDLMQKRGEPVQHFPRWSDPLRRAVDALEAGEVPDVS